MQSTYLLWVQEVVPKLMQMVKGEPPVHRPLLLQGKLIKIKTVYKLESWFHIIEMLSGFNIVLYCLITMETLSTCS